MTIKLNLFSFVALLAACSLAQAESLPAARRCVSIADREARLACFDAAFAAPAQAVSPAVPPAATPAPTSSAPVEATFGDEGLRAAKQASAKVPRTLTAVITAVAARPGDLFRLSLDNGQVWDTRDANWAANFKPGDSVQIDHMLMGGYQLTAATGGRSVGAKRIQ